MKNKLLKKSVSLVVSLFTAASIVTSVSATEYASKTFSDVSQRDWFYKDVEYTYSNGIIKGITDNTFEPSSPLSRAMAATLLYRLAGSPVINDGDGNRFKDVEDNRWYTDAVCWASQSSIAKGYEYNVFAPNDNITRADFATMLMRYASFAKLILPDDIKQSLNDESHHYDFTDEEAIPKYAKLPVSILAHSFVIRGNNTGEFSPKNSITRAEAAAMVHRFDETAEKQHSTLLEKYSMSMVVEMLLDYGFSQPGDSSKANHNFIVGLSYDLGSIFEIPEVNFSIEIYSYGCRGSGAFFLNTDDMNMNYDTYLPSGTFYPFVITDKMDLRKLETLELRDGDLIKVDITITIGDESETLTFYPYVNYTWY